MGICRPISQRYNNKGNDTICLSPVPAFESINCGGFPIHRVGIIVFLKQFIFEEAIFRPGIISPSMDRIDASYIALISAIIFGVAHFSGMPHGLIGMLKAGLLGWFLAKSVIETQGIFWAWSIHFIQDVVIYLGFMIN
ncbi:MAG: CPBP family intramembrane metalloprotease [Candidatus Thiodiazotropha taylori]|nr:CPBP family intramembrane metalloprotease [Candidatus Thiodiazotropha taylori]